MKLFTLITIKYFSINFLITHNEEQHEAVISLIYLNMNIYFFKLHEIEKFLFFFR